MGAPVYGIQVDKSSTSIYFDELRILPPQNKTSETKFSKVSYPKRRPFLQAVAKYMYRACPAPPPTTLSSELHQPIQE